MTEPMTPERINELRRTASIQAGANPDNSVVSALLHTHGTVLGECLDEIERLRGWLRYLRTQLNPADYYHGMYSMAGTVDSLASRALNGEEVPS